MGALRAALCVHVVRKEMCKREAHAYESRDHGRTRIPSSNQKMTDSANQKPQKHVMKAPFSRRIGSRAGGRGGRSVEKLRFNHVIGIQLKDDFEDGTPRAI